MNILPFKFKNNNLRNNAIVALVGATVLYILVSISFYLDETRKEVEKYLLSNKEFQGKFGEKPELNLYKRMIVQPSITVENERTLGYSVYRYEVLSKERETEKIAVVVEDQNEDGIHEFRIQYRR